MPAQTTEDSNQSQQLHAQDDSSAQGRPRTAKRVSFERNRYQYRRRKSTAFQLNVDRYEYAQPIWLNHGQLSRHELR